MHNAQKNYKSLGYNYGNYSTKHFTTHAMHNYLDNINTSKPKQNYVKTLINNFFHTILDSIFFAYFIIIFCFLHSYVKNIYLYIDIVFSYVVYVLDSSLLDCIIQWLSFSVFVIEIVVGIIYILRDLNI